MMFQKIQEIAEIKVRGKNNELGNLSKDKKEITNIIGDICKICLYDYGTNTCNKYMILCKVVDQEKDIESIKSIKDIINDLKNEINNTLGSEDSKKNLTNDEIKEVENKVERGKLYIFKNYKLEVKEVEYKRIGFYGDLVCYLVLFKINIEKL